jgi:carbon storage regulator
MLVLSRKVGERVVIAGEVVVQVLEVHGQQIRLGVEAPPEVTILREELSPQREPSLASRRTVRKPR